jgi:aspartyl-tRNA(Asn)/glutamyl-tRNA(Gln) amidotransferase subunit B
MELVTEPVIHDAETAGRFGKELQLLLRELGVSEANMEKGEMRVEANISISDSEILGTKVEVKNLNSFKAVEGAILYEVKRHTALLEKGEKITQETRGWDDNKSATFSQRKKESSHDYRYFPDPDIPSFNTEQAGVYDVSRLSEISTRIPSKIRLSYENLGLPSKQIETLIENTSIRYYFDAVCALDPKLALVSANYLTSDVLGAVAAGTMPPIVASEAASKSFAELCQLIEGNEVTSRVAKDLLPDVFQGLSALALVESRGLRIKKDSATLERIVSEVLLENPAVALEYKGGKVASIQFLVGQGMKKGKGAVDPASLRIEIERMLTL